MLPPQRLIHGLLADYWVRLEAGEVSVPALCIWVLPEPGDSVENLYAALGQALDEVLQLLFEVRDKTTGTEYERELCLRFCEEVEALKLTRFGVARAPGWLLNLLCADRFLFEQPKVGLRRVAEELSGAHSVFRMKRPGPKSPGEQR